MKSTNIIILGFLVFVFPSCSYLSVSEKDAYQPNYSQQDTAHNNTCVIMGSINDNSKEPFTRMILAYPVDSKNIKFRDFVILGKSSEFMLYLPAGKYLLLLLRDSNNDDLFEKTEITGVFQNGNPIHLQEGDVVNSITLQKKIEGIPLSDEFQIMLDQQSNFYQAENGQTRRIYDAVFSRDNADVGIWSPSRFMSSFGANLYLEAPYDPGKIPVFFVHGSNGSPQDWVYFRIRLDKTRYQPVYFYYPSGMRLPLIAKILNEQLWNFKKKTGFKQAGLVAHSMGGLITHELLTTHGLEEYRKLFKLYVTFATPWSGFESADKAMDTAPIKLPFWTDVASRSMFLKKLMNKSLPEEIDHYLFYGKADKISQGRALDERAMADVRGRFAFHVDHETILSNRDVFRKFRDLLDSTFGY